MVSEEDRFKATARRTASSKTIMAFLITNSQVDATNSGLANSAFAHAPGTSGAGIAYTGDPPTESTVRFHCPICRQTKFAPPAVFSDLP